MSAEQLLCSSSGEPELASTDPRHASPLLRALNARPIIITELYARKCCLPTLLAAARELATAGTTAVSVADAPFARPSPSSFVLARRIQEHAGVVGIPHLTCRDRNRLGLVSELLGAHLDDLHAVLALTGDGVTHSPAGGLPERQREVRNSFELIRLIAGLNDGTDEACGALSATSFLIGAAVDPNKRNATAEINRLKQKVALGAGFAMCQITFDLDRLATFFPQVRSLSIPVFPGLTLATTCSLLNYLKTEANIVVPDELANRMPAANPAQRKLIAMETCHRGIDLALRLGAPGIYIGAPCSDAPLLAELVAYTHERAQTGLWPPPHLARSQNTAA